MSGSAVKEPASGTARPPSRDAEYAGCTVEGVGAPRGRRNGRFRIGLYAAEMIRRPVLFKPSCGRRENRSSRDKVLVRCCIACRTLPAWIRCSISDPLVRKCATTARY
jgi:hypothetical protein